MNNAFHTRRTHPCSGIFTCHHCWASCSGYCVAGPHLKPFLLPSQIDPLDIIWICIDFPLETPLEDLQEALISQTSGPFYEVLEPLRTRVTATHITWTCHKTRSCHLGKLAPGRETHFKRHPRVPTSSVQISLPSVQNIMCNWKTFLWKRCIPFEEMLSPAGREAGPQWESVAATTEPLSVARKAQHICVIPAAERQILSLA